MASPVERPAYAKAKSRKAVDNVIIDNEYFSKVDAKIDTYNLDKYAQIDAGSETSNKVSEYVIDCLKELLNKQTVLMDKIYVDRLNVELNSYEQVKYLLSNQSVAMKESAKETHESSLQMISSISNSFKDQITSKTETFFVSVKENIKNFIAQILDSRYASDRFSLNEYKKRIREELFVSRRAVDLFRQAYDDGARHLHMEKMRLLIDELGEKQKQNVDEMKVRVDSSELKSSVWEKRVRDIERDRDLLKSQLENEEKASEILLKKVENMQRIIKENRHDSEKKHNIHEVAFSLTKEDVAIKDGEIEHLKNELENIKASLEVVKHEADESKANFERIKSDLNATIGNKNKEIDNLKNDIIALGETKVSAEITEIDNVEATQISHEAHLTVVDLAEEIRSVAYADAETMTEIDELPELPYETSTVPSESLTNRTLDEPVTVVEGLECVAASIAGEIVEGVESVATSIAGEIVEGVESAAASIAGEIVEEVESVAASIAGETESKPQSILPHSDTVEENSQTEWSRKSFEVNVLLETVQNIENVIDRETIAGNQREVKVVNDYGNHNIQTLFSDVEPVIVAVTHSELETTRPTEEFSSSDQGVKEAPLEFISVLDMESIVSQGNVMGSSTFSLELDSQCSLPQKASPSRSGSSRAIFPTVFTSSQVKELLDKHQDLEKELQTKILSLEYQNSKLSNRIRSDESYFEKQDTIHKLRLRERSLLLKALVEKVKVLTEKLEKDKFFIKQQKILDSSGLPVINVTRPQTGFSKQALDMFSADILFSPSETAFNLNRSESAPTFRPQNINLKDRPSTSTAVNILKKIDIHSGTDGPRLPVTDDKVDAFYTEDIFDAKADTLKSLGVLPLKSGDMNEIKDIRKQIMEVLSSQKPHIPRNIQLATTLAAKTKMQGRNLHAKPFVASKSTKERNTSPQPRDVVVSPPEKVYKGKKKGDNCY